MDALASFLDGPRARSALLLKVVFEPPWSIRVEDEAPLTVIAVTHGSSWLQHPSRNGVEPIELVAGDVVVARGPDHYTIASGPDTSPSIVIEPGGECRTLDGRPLVDSMVLGVRTWGNRAEAEDVMLVGTYQSVGEIGRRLLDALPPVVVLRSGDWNCAAVGLLAAEIVDDAPGQQVVLDRLLDLVLVSALRTAFADPVAGSSTWLDATADPVVGDAIRLMQDEPDQPWTVAGLADRVGVSRATLARRFHALVGEPPMTFLTSWRMALAADLLIGADDSVNAVALAVGYTSPFTFSTAFKRHHGDSPRAYRRRVWTDSGDDRIRAAATPR